MFFSYMIVRGFYKLDVLSDDKMFSELLERMEYCKKAKRFSEYDAEQILHYGKDLERFKKFDSSIPEDLKYDIYKFYNEIFANCPENVDKFIEFCNKMPEDWFKAYFKSESYGYYHKEELCNLFMNFGANCYNEKGYRTVENGYWVNKNYEPIHRTPDELIKRIDLLKKVLASSFISMRKIIEIKLQGFNGLVVPERTILGEKIIKSFFLAIYFLS